MRKLPLSRRRRHRRHNGEIINFIRVSFIALSLSLTLSLSHLPLSRLAFAFASYDENEM